MGVGQDNVCQRGVGLEGVGQWVCQRDVGQRVCQEGAWTKGMGGSSGAWAVKEVFLEGRGRLPKCTCLPFGTLKSPKESRHSENKGNRRQPAE